MTTARTNWIDVDLDGLRKLLARRGKEFALYELTQNAWDENISRVEITLSRPEGGRSQLIVVDDSPEGFHDLTQAYTMYGESKKKANPEKRGAFCVGEKFVLALCSEVTITSTTGRVIFDERGRTHSKHPSHRRNQGTAFNGWLRLTIEEWEQISEKVKLLLPDVPTFYNGVEIPKRTPLNSFTATLPTVFADEHGQLRPRKRSTLLHVYEPLPGEKPMIYEMGIPVVETGDTWHIDIGQKVPLNMERDNVTPAFLRAVRVAVVNSFGSQLPTDTVTTTWVREAASDQNIESLAFKHIMRERFGTQAVVYDPSDVGSNREASSKDYTVVSGGSLSAGEWENVRRTGAITPAGQLFPTNHGTKEPDKRYARSEWTMAMHYYAKFVEYVSPHLVGHQVTLSYIKDARMVCGQFFGSWYMVNLAHHDVTNWERNIELMLHELAHTVVESNDHLSHEFYETVGTLGAKLVLLAVEDAEVARFLKEATA
jgi:hypothetical protein